jgi:hypothetical protein
MRRVPTSWTPASGLAGPYGGAAAAGAVWPQRPLLINLGRTNRAGHLRFTVPNASPGAYAFVIFCASCYSGEGGSLIVNDRPGDLLQIRRNDHGLAGGFGRAMRAILTTAPRLVAFLLP